MKKILIFLILVLLTLPALSISSKGMSRTSKGPTALQGRTTQQDSNFEFYLTGPYWYKNLDLYLYTWRNTSDYSVYVNGEQIDSGTFSEGELIVNYTLPTNRPVNLKVEIDEYSYSYRNKLITQRSSSDWRSPEKDKRGQIYSSSEITNIKLSTWGQALGGVGVSSILMYFLAKKKKEEQIEDVIE